MTEYKYTIEVTLRSEVPKVDKLQISPEMLEFNLGALMNILPGLLKNVKVNVDKSSVEKEEEKK